MPKILIVDDEPQICALLGEMLVARGFEVVTAPNAAEGLALLCHEAPSVVLLDLVMPGKSGFEMLPEIKALLPDVPVIILTAQGKVATVVEAMRRGAYDYLTKPFDLEHLTIAVARAVERSALGAEVQTLRSRLEEGAPLRELMGPSAAVAHVIRQVEQVARSSFTVLLQGETGAGKELVARAIHRQSEHRLGPFVAVDCGAIPETLVESELFGHEKGAFTGADQKKQGQFVLAHGGTLLLDEVVNLPHATRAKLLRVLQERQVHPLGSARLVPVDVRFIAAANVPLEQEVRAGRFRRDLYYRLSEFTITVPPLLERREDILHLATHFLAETRMEFRRPVRCFSEQALARLVEYSWPGNVRELRNVVRRAVLVSTDIVGPEALFPPTVDIAGPALPDAGARSPDMSLREAGAHALAAAERQASRQALESDRGNKSAAARLLKTAFKTLHVKMRKYDIAARKFLER